MQNIEIKSSCLKNESKMKREHCDNVEREFLALALIKALLQINS